MPIYVQKVNVVTDKGNDNKKYHRAQIFIYGDCRANGYVSKLYDPYITDTGFIKYKISVSISVEVIGSLYSSSFSSCGNRIRYVIDKAEYCELINPWVDYQKCLIDEQEVILGHKNVYVDRHNPEPKYTIGSSEANELLGNVFYYIKDSDDYDVISLFLDLQLR